MSKILIKNAQIINENKLFYSDILICNDIITKIDQNIEIDSKYSIIDAEGLLLIPGVIDDQVHFREPGLIHKGSIATESAAAILGGTTSFMEMPNTSPATLSIDLLEEKYLLASKSSYANYSFYLGVSNSNFDEIQKFDPTNTCGIKIFMGSSTGNMLVDNEESLNNIFKNFPYLIATHCEDENTIKKNKEFYLDQINNSHSPSLHFKIRDREACIISSKYAISLAKKYNSRLHILHISTKEECLFFDATPLNEKKITSEVCVHHLWFDNSDYPLYKNGIVCNPAIKEKNDKNTLFDSLLEGKIDVIATDHAPHTIIEKERVYPDCPSGIPLIQHSLLMMLEFVHEKKMNITTLVEKMCHNPAICFKIYNRGFIREGYKADLVLIDMNNSTYVTKENIKYQCGWSPFENKIFRSKIKYTIVNGTIVQKNGIIIKRPNVERLQFKI